MNKTELVKFWITQEQKERLAYWQERAGFPTLAAYLRAAALRAGPLLTGELSVAEFNQRGMVAHTQRPWNGPKPPANAARNQADSV